MDGEVFLFAFVALAWLLQYALFVPYLDPDNFIAVAIIGAFGITFALCMYGATLGKRRAIGRIRGTGARSKDRAIARSIPGRSITVWLEWEVPIGC